MIYGMFQIDESEVLDTRGAVYITVGDLVQEIHHLRADIASKDAALRVAEPHVEGNIRRVIREGGYKIHEGDTVQKTVDANCDLRQIRDSMSKAV